MADVRDVNLNRLAIFAAVVEAGSLTAAAGRLGLAKTMVSTHMQRLEAEVGASLLVRTTRRLNVTDAGRAFYEASVAILRTANEALAAVSGGTGPLRGTLRVSAPVDYGSVVVVPALAELRAANPELDVELLCNDRVIDLVAENVDVAVRLGRLADSNYRAARVDGYERWLVASPEWIAAWGAPRTPEALADKPYVARPVPGRPQALELVNARGDKRSVRCKRAFTTDTAPAARAAALAGVGFGYLTDFSIAADVEAGRLVRLLPAWRSPAAGVHVVYPSTSHPSPKVRALIDALKTRPRHPF
ncbi:LysR family transcriptional regulator [Paraburkholderia kururiensis]|uniref:LysR family transcriptional regulator n=1 Tax=Paraburkholderia kururiensis TaxID=984307 RepID=A0ABZ0WPT3_9BURK|nr:LysR family transcriptional regulator [Paraburkholderia kururiensis]WQD79270.1 LysR family transcriptional regulator [Paraburkholderia kururiensis]